MAARTITNEEIFAACYDLAQNAKKITVATVHGHELVGHRGGGGTISQGIKLWRAAQDDHATPTAVPQPVVLSEAATAVVETAKNAMLATLSTALQSILKVTSTESQEQVAALVKGLEATQAELIDERDGILAIEAEREKELERLDQVIADLTEKAKAEAEETLRRVSTMEAQAQGRESQIAALEQRVAAIAADAQAQTVQIAKAEERHDADTRTINDLEQRLAAATATAKDLAAKVADLEPKLASTEAREKAAQTRIQDLTAEAKNQAAHVAKMEAAATKAQAETKEQAANVASLSERVGFLTASLEAATKAKAETEKKAQEATKAHADEKKAMEKRIRDLEATEKP